MMEWITKAAWVSLAIIHVMPASILFAPSLINRLYGTEPTGEVGILLVHRGALFLAVVAAAVYAAFDPNARRLASVVVAISVIGFLVVYARSGTPVGSLRLIAVMDVIALIPLVWILWDAWIGGQHSS